MTCTHDIVEREVACEADGLCPICLFERLEDLQEALQRIDQWSKAYPLTVFPEPDWKKAQILLKGGDPTSELVGFTAISQDVERPHIMLLHFDHKVTDVTRQELVAAINARTIPSGITLDGISAHCMRHVVEGVGKIARQALGLTVEQGK